MVSYVCCPPWEPHGAKEQVKQVLCHWRVVSNAWILIIQLRVAGGYHTVGQHSHCRESLIWKASQIACFLPTLKDVCIHQSQNKNCHERKSQLSTLELGTVAFILHMALKMWLVENMETIHCQVTKHSLHYWVVTWTAGSSHFPDRKLEACISQLILARLEILSNRSINWVEYKAV